jgi:hypothetical protein
VAVNCDTLAKIDIECTAWVSVGCGAWLDLLSQFDGRSINHSQKS